MVIGASIGCLHEDKGQLVICLRESYMIYISGTFFDTRGEQGDVADEDASLPLTFLAWCSRIEFPPLWQLTTAFLADLIT